VLRLDPRDDADPFGFLRPWNEVPALMGSAPPTTPPLDRHRRGRHLPDGVASNWRITAQLVLSLNPAADLDRAKVVYEAHSARARWMTRVGYRLLLKQD
jgi:hypothetical protein